MIEKRESGYLSSSSYPSPHSSAMMSPPQSVATPPDSAIYTVSKERERERERGGGDLFALSEYTTIWCDVLPPATASVQYTLW